MDYPFSPDTTELVSDEKLRDLAVWIAATIGVRTQERRQQLIANQQESSVEDALGKKTKTTECDPVTVVDQENEALIRQFLSELRPADAILGEEGGGHVSLHADDSTEGEVLAGEDQSSGITWVLDPIDGTVNFLYGLPAYAVSIGVARQGRVVAGAVANIALNEVFSAHSGGGSSVIPLHVAIDHPDHARTAPRLSCSQPTSLGTTLLGTGFSYTSSKRRQQGSLIAQLLPHCRDIRRGGSAALDLCMVAAGRLDAYYEHGLHPWDRAAGGIIAAEAGAVTQIPDPQEEGHQGTLNYAIAPSIAPTFLELMDSVGGLDPMPLGHYA